MDAMYEGPLYRVHNGSIERFVEGYAYYDVDWGQSYTEDNWVPICKNTPENRRKYNLS